jgi:hypothetical protein
MDGVATKLTAGKANNLIDEVSLKIPTLIS